MLNALEPWHLLIIAALVVVLFGAKRLPDTAHSLGRSMRIFRAEVRDSHATPPGPTVPSAVPAAPTITAAGNVAASATIDGR